MMFWLFLKAAAYDSVGEDLEPFFASFASARFLVVVLVD
jgi:hypothetical protein